MREARWYFLAVKGDCNFILAYYRCGGKKEAYAKAQKIFISRQKSHPEYADRLKASKHSFVVKRCKALDAIDHINIIETQRIDKLGLPEANRQSIAILGKYDLIGNTSDLRRFSYKPVGSTQKRLLRVASALAVLPTCLYFARKWAVNHLARLRYVKR